MPIFPNVIERLKEDDSILGMGDFEFLDVYFAFEDWPETFCDLLPTRLLQRAVRFVRRLDENAARVADRPYVPEMRSPNGRFGLRSDDDLIVAFCDHRPVWYREKKGEEWSPNALWATRGRGGGSSVEGGEDMAHRWLGEDRPAGPPDAEEPECLGPRNAEIHASNDPARLLPDPLLGVLSHFWRVLRHGHEQLEGTPYLLVPEHPNSPRRHRCNDEFVVAYWPVGNGEYEPAWCWKRKPDGAWKLYMLLSHPTKEIDDDYALRELGEGDWD